MTQYLKKKKNEFFGIRYLENHAIHVYEIHINEFYYLLNLVHGFLPLIFLKVRKNNIIDMITKHTHTSNAIIEVTMLTVIGKKLNRSKRRPTSLKWPERRSCDVNIAYEYNTN